MSTATETRGVRLRSIFRAVFITSAAAGTVGLIDLAPWRRSAQVLMLSGNIEAHESVLSFKTLWPQMVAMAALGAMLLTISTLRFRKSLD